MNLTRREALALGAGLVLAGRVPAVEKKKRLGVVIHSYSIRLGHPPKGEGPNIDDPSAFLDHCVKIGAGGIQTSLGARGEEYNAKLRAKAEQHGMYIEGSVALPKNDADLRLRYFAHAFCASLACCAVNGTYNRAGSWPTAGLIGAGYYGT